MRREGLTMHQGSEWLTPTELGQLLGVTRRTIFRWIEDGCLPEPQRWNPRVVKWRKDDLADILQHGPKPPGTFKPAPSPVAEPKTTRPKGTTRGRGKSDKRG